MIVMSDFRFYFSIALYSVALYLCGVYIYLIEYFEILVGFVSIGLLQLNAEYDYIVGFVTVLMCEIVGCGSAGSTAALRLSENEKVSVLVLEAGPRGTSSLDIPTAGILTQLSSIDWKYRTESQNNAAKAFKHQMVRWPRGRVVGGSGRINNMLYVRGHPTDFKDWIGESETYDYEYDILQYFKKSEKYQHIQREHDTDQVHRTPLGAAFLDAAKTLGYPIRDVNGRYSTGFTKPQVSVKSGSRWTPGHHVMSENRPNLVLQANAHVDRLLFKADFEAYAVAYTYLGMQYKVNARKAIILSAGTVGTPQLLMLSGIGPKDHLSDLGIPTKVDLPVGNNLQDHVTTGADLILLNTSLGFNPTTMLSLFAAYSYFVLSSGLWTNVGCDAIGIVHTNHSLNDQDQPDLQLMAIPVGASSDGGKHLIKAGGFSDDVWENYFKHFVGQNTISILPVVLHAKSRGRLRLKDANPTSQPLINPNYLSDSSDVEVLLKGIELIKKIIATEPMQRLGAKLNDRMFPGCEDFEFDTTQYWTCYVRHLTIGPFHPIGTCKMGQKDGVVDYDFRVRGTNKLFVADASVIPSSLSANPNAAVIMIGEKVASSIAYYNYLNENSCTVFEVLVPKTFC